MANAAAWARKRAGIESASSGSPPPSTSSSNSAAESVSSASDEGYQDDKFHLPVDHSPFMLLPGWDKPPAPPPAPPGSSSSGGSSSGSESHASEEPGGSSGSSGSEGEGEAPPPPPPPPPGFACSNCASFKALGNGTFGCENVDYQRWAGTDKLVETKSGRQVLNADRACSDWFSPATGPSAQPIPTRHNEEGA